MASFFERLFGGKSTDYKLLVKDGALIVDVRTPQEFAGGHIAGAKNIPLNVLKGKINDLRKTGKPVIAVCASGARSGIAKALLAGEGIEAYNGGSWASLSKKL